MKRFLLYSAGITLALGMAALFLFLGALERLDWTYPAVYLGQKNIGLLSRDDTRTKIDEILTEYENKPLLFAFEGEAAKVTPQELGVFFDREATFRKIPFVESKNPIRHFLTAIMFHRVEPVFSFERGKLIKTLEEKFSKVQFVENARFRFDNTLKKVVIEPEKTGVRIEEDQLAQNMEDTLGKLGRAPVFLTVSQQLPTVYQADLEAQKEALLANFPRKLVFRFEKQKWELNFPRDIEFIEFRKNGEAFTPTISEKNLETFLETREISKALEFPPDALKIYRGPEEKIKFEGHGKSGRRIERSLLIAGISESLAQKFESIEIPVSEVEAPLNISEDLRAIGVKELIGVGYTTYYGSPKNRIHNINVGVEHFNGTFIAAGDTYSFNDNLGPVDASTGYKEELVIKSDGTKPEFGGGLCQVSTTFYRGAIYSGLTIVDRSPHTYAVTYYSQVGGHGLDATIYPGSKDLKFLNDTPGAIVVHAYTDGLEAYFKFYGTSDGRSVSFEGPFIANRRSAPPDEFVYTKDKPEGQKELKEKPHAGFDATWYRYVTKKGETTKETIFSRYRAMPAKWLVGGEGPEKTDPEVEAAKQFE